MENEEIMQTPPRNGLPTPEEVIQDLTAQLRQAQRDLETHKKSILLAQECFASEAERLEKKIAELEASLSDARQTSKDNERAYRVQLNKAKELESQLLMTTSNRERAALEKVKELEAELKEQCRLLGKSAEREKDLRAELEKLKEKCKPENVWLSGMARISDLETKLEAARCLLEQWTNGDSLKLLDETEDFLASISKEATPTNSVETGSKLVDADGSP